MNSFFEWWRRGSVWVWLSGATLALSLLMVAGLILFLAIKGMGFFWPGDIHQIQLADGTIWGQVTNHEEESRYHPARTQVKIANRDVYGQDFRWVDDAEILNRSFPGDALYIEKLDGGPFIGRLVQIEEHGQVLAVGDKALPIAQKRLSGAKAYQAQIKSIEQSEAGALSNRLEKLRLDGRKLELQGKRNPRAAQEIEDKKQDIHKQFEQLQARLEALRNQSRALTVTLETADGNSRIMPLANIVRIVPANSIGLFGKAGVYLSRLWEFVSADPREANTEGGIFPAIFGTVMMVLIMSIVVVPLGVLAALFLREYARDGWVVRTVRISVNNLAGVPSIVFGVFGLGFFVVTVGGGIDNFFFPERFPAPTFKTGGILWASLTLALLTLPVVIVATEEALAAVPRSQREGSLALGATKWQTLWNVVIPGASQGILTGLILAMARGAGEVAPLMLTGVVKLAPSLPLDGSFPFIHLERKFMHLGFHIYDVGFQSPNSEAAKPMVFMTALLLLLIVLVLNIFALRLRRKLRRRTGGSSF
ncbi:MAG: phosphate ABC transporter permease PstA [Holophagales bacterium]|jgi:phosphate transport system permease protein|nr:phosphate ABC transporter permease PstA [Holophagales bacterium]